MKTMTLSDGVAYVEAPDETEDGRYLTCGACALRPGGELCDESIDVSEILFGGACGVRNVIYIKADPQPVKE